MLIVLGGIVIGGLSAWRRMNALPDESTDGTQEYSTVKSRMLQRTVTATGKIVPEQSTALAFSIPGKITAVHGQVGDTVNKNDVLIVMDGDNFGRRADEELIAPFDGRILAVHTFVDDVVTAGVPLITVGYRTSFIEWIASEAEVFDLENGQVADITIPSYDDGARLYYGTVELIDPIKTEATSVSTESGFRVRIRPTDVPTAVLEHIGLTVDVAVIVAQTDAVASIERAAIQYDNDQPFVYVSSNLRRQDVTLGFDGDEYIEILSGVKIGDTIALSIPASHVSSPF